MNRFWQLDYKQEIIDPDGKIELVSEWGRIGKRFPSLEEALLYVAEELLEHNWKSSRETPLKLLDTGEFYGEELFDVERQIRVDKPERVKKLAKVRVTGRVFLLEEEEATKEDYLKMEGIVS